MARSSGVTGESGVKVLSRRGMGRLRETEKEKYRSKRLAWGASQFHAWRRKGGTLTPQGAGVSDRVYDVLWRDTANSYRLLWKGAQHLTVAPPSDLKLMPPADKTQVKTGVKDSVDAFSTVSLPEHGAGQMKGEWTQGGRGKVSSTPGKQYEKERIRGKAKTMKK